MSKGNESKWQESEQVDQDGPGAGEIRDSRRTQLQSGLLSEDKAVTVTEISPKPHPEESLPAQDVGAGAIDLIPRDLSMKVEDTSHSSQRSQEEEPVFPPLALDPSASSVTEPQSKDTAVYQSLPLPTNLLTTYRKQNGEYLVELASFALCMPATGNH